MKEGGLTEAGCRTRQSRVREQLRLHNLDAALLADDRHVYYLTGYWTAPAFRRAVLIERDGPVTLLIEQSTECTCVADDVVKFAGGHQASLVDDQLAAAVMALGTRLKPAMRLGCDQGVPAGLANVRCTADFFPAMLAVRRRKEPDEIALMKRVIAATEAGYERLRQMLRPGVDTVTLYANILAAVAEHAGEFIGELGNDFQIGSGFSAVRPRDGRPNAAKSRSSTWLPACAATAATFAAALSWAANRPMRSARLIPASSKCSNPLSRQPARG